MIGRVLVLVIVLLSPAAWAHKPSDAHVRLALEGDQLVGRIDISVRDLDAALMIDDGDGALTWGELHAARDQIADYIAQRVTFEQCPMAQGPGSLVDLSDGAYWSTPLTVRCAREPRSLTLRYNLLFDVDAQHRGLVHVAGQTAIVRDAEPVQLALGDTTSLKSFVFEGIWHIWIGFDHILFLICLILPAVWPSRHRGLRDVTGEVFEIVTAFTLAHSITLVISAVGLFTLPSRFVETAIAASVVIAALNNIARVVDARWAVAFALGLLHGFGFSSVLVDLGLPSHELIGALLGFNVGVELGQAAIVLVTLPILYVIRSTVAYRVLLFGGSAAVALLASLWTYQRFIG
jgi:hypothetical protein